MKIFYRVLSGLFRKCSTRYRLLWSTVVVMTGCSMQPTSPELAAFYRDSEIVVGDGFLHRVRFWPRAGSVLNIYIEGDGRPWWRRDRVALDPTSKNVVTLPLATRDSGPALFLGRPCYFAVDDTRCESLWWTHARYSAEVVQSLSAVIDRYVGQFQKVRLIGHSGGGVLSMLLAAYRNDVDTVITLAANLDIDAWADAHRYSRLDRSLNPVLLSYSPKLVQWHFGGQQDKNVSPDQLRHAVGLITERISRRGKQSDVSINLEILNGIDHSCCWQYYWRHMLAVVEGKKGLPSIEGNPVVKRVLLQFEADAGG